MDKELFDRDINGTPAMSKRIAYGEPSPVLAENMTFTQLKALLADANGSWNEATLGANWTAIDLYLNSRPGFWYRLNKIGQLEITISVFHNGTTPFNSSITILPVGFRPPYGRSFDVLLNNGTQNVFYKMHINTNGQVEINVMSIPLTLFPAYMACNHVVTL